MRPPTLRHMPVTHPSHTQNVFSAREDGGETCVLIAINLTPVAVMAVADPLKPEARAVVAALQAQVRAGGRLPLRRPAALSKCDTAS